MHKKFITIKSYWIFLTVLTTTMIAPTSWAHDDCTPYNAVFRLEGASPFGPLNGGGTYIIGDLPPQPAQVTAVIKNSAVFNPSSGAVEITFSSMALFAPDADGNINILTGVDSSIGVATGPGTFESTTRSRITGGVGLYEDVTGRARSTNTTTVDLTTGYTVADIKVHGKICGIGEAVINP